MRDKRFIEWLLPATIAGVMLLHCVIVSSVKRFWGDELCTYYELNDPSFSHMLAAQADQINATPPTYFLIAWPLAQIFGTAELTLRMFSCIGIIVAFVVTWWMLRESFGFWPASVSVVVSFLGSNLVMNQVSEARFYGLFLAEISLALLVALRLMTNQNVSLKLLFANCLIHAALVTTHYFGWLYSVAILIAMAGMQARDRSRLIRCVGSGVLGWVAFVPWIPAFRHHLALSQGPAWIPRPGIAGVYALLGTESANYGAAALLIVAVAFLVRWLAPESPVQVTRCEKEPNSRELVLAALMVALLAVPLCAWAKSRVGQPLFVDRYVLADVIVWSFAFAYGVRAATNCLSAQPSTTRERNARRAALAALSFVVVWYSGMTIVPFLGKSMPKLPDPAGVGVAGNPIVAENLNMFLPLQFYSHGSADYRFVLDRETARAAPDGSANTQYQIGAGFHRQYPELQIETTEECLRQYKEFVVIDSPNYLWFERFIQNNPKYTYHELPELTAQLKEFERVANNFRALLVRIVDSKTVEENGPRR